nr:c-type cytochrome [Sphingobium lignivorans]
MLRYGAHGRMVAPPGRIVVQLAMQIARIETGEARRRPAIAFAIDAMTGEAGSRRAAVRAAERDHFPRGTEAIVPRRQVATGERKQGKDETKLHIAGNGSGRRAVPVMNADSGTIMLRPRGIVLMAAIGLTTTALGACKPAELRPREADAQAIARGQDAAARLGCGACHTMPGIGWPQGRVGPDLHGYGDRALIAGRVPNRPEQLARFVRDAPSIAPGTAMPAIPMKDEEARDIAAWLQSFRAR